MISKASIRNFKSLRDVQVHLGRFAAFVGPNASGKSSILQALDHLCRTFRVDHPENLDADLQQSWSRGAADQIELVGESNGRAYRYRARSRQSPHMSGFGVQEEWTGHGRGVAVSLAASDWKQWKPEPPGSTPLPLSVWLRLEASRLVHPNQASPDPTVMAPDGTGLHTALATMALNAPDSWPALQ